MNIDSSSAFSSNRFLESDSNTVRIDHSDSGSRDRNHIPRIQAFVGRDYIESSAARLPAWIRFEDGDVIAPRYVRSNGFALCGLHPTPGAVRSMNDSN